LTPGVLAGTIGLTTLVEVKMPRFKVAAVQTLSFVDRQKENSETIIARIREAAESGAKLVVFPECMNNGYVWRDQAHSCSGSDTIPGPLTDAIAKICKELSVHVALGMSERDGDKVYNSAALIGPGGFIGKYQKNFLFDFDPIYFTFGTTGYPVFDTPLGRLGMFICADARIPEGARALTMKGAEVLLHITNNTTHEQHELHEPARAHENEVWMVCADKAGQEEGLTYPGHSQVIHPDGTLLVQGSQCGHEIVYAEIDTDEVAAVRQRADSLIRARRPDTYKLLLEKYDSLPYAKIAETPVIPSHLAVLASPTQICNFEDDAAQTLQRALKRADELGKENARLIVYPELFMTAAQPTAEQARKSAEHTSEALKGFGQVASRWGAHIVVNLVEADAGKFHHTAFVVGPNSKVVGRYRKVHLTSRETDWASPGNDYSVLELPFGNLGLMIGHEVCFFEVSRILACMGADVIALPANLRAPRENALFACERALENKLFVVVANRTDAACPGGSTVYFPNAATSKKAGAGQDEYVFSYLNLAWARDKQIRPGTDLVRNRRPQFYEPIVQARSI
jgi:predicted amidohydrolase